MTDITRVQGGPPGPEAEAITTARANDLGRRGPAQEPQRLNFGEILRARQGLASSAPMQPAAGQELRFSAHAQTRMQSRRIELNQTQLDRLTGAVQKAAVKGSRDSLVLMDDLAMVVSVKNRTVVTIVDKENLKQNVFTNIDSAVIA